MEGVAEGHHGLPARGHARDLHRVLHRLGAGGKEDALGRTLERRQRVELLRKLYVRFVRVHLKCRVRETL